MSVRKVNELVRVRKKKTDSTFQTYFLCTANVIFFVVSSVQILVSGVEYSLKNEEMTREYLALHKYLYSMRTYIVLY